MSSSAPVTSDKIQFLTRDDISYDTRTGSIQGSFKVKLIDPLVVQAGTSIQLSKAKGTIQFPYYLLPEDVKAVNCYWNYSGNPNDFVLRSDNLDALSEPMYFDTIDEMTGFLGSNIERKINAIFADMQADLSPTTAIQVCSFSFDPWLPFTSTLYRLRFNNAAAAIGTIPSGTAINLDDQITKSLTVGAMYAIRNILDADLIVIQQYKPAASKAAQDQGDGYSFTQKPITYLGMTAYINTAAVNYTDQDNWWALKMSIIYLGDWCPFPSLYKKHNLENFQTSMYFMRAYDRSDNAQVTVKSNSGLVDATKLAIYGLISEDAVPTVQTTAKVTADWLEAFNSHDDVNDVITPSADWLDLSQKNLIHFHLVCIPNGYPDAQRAKILNIRLFADKTQFETIPNGEDGWIILCIKGLSVGKIRFPGNLYDDKNIAFNLTVSADQKSCEITVGFYKFYNARQLTMFDIYPFRQPDYFKTFIVASDFTVEDHQTMARSLRYFAMVATNNLGDKSFFGFHSFTGAKINTTPATLAKAPLLHTELSPVYSFSNPFEADEDITFWIDPEDIEYAIAGTYDIDVDENAIISGTTTIAAVDYIIVKGKPLKTYAVGPNVAEMANFYTNNPNIGQVFAFINCTVYNQYATPFDTVLICDVIKNEEVIHTSIKAITSTNTYQNHTFKLSLPVKPDEILIKLTLGVLYRTDTHQDAPQVNQPMLTVTSILFKTTTSKLPDNIKKNKFSSLVPRPIQSSVMDNIDLVNTTPNNPTDQGVAVVISKRLQTLLGERQSGDGTLYLTNSITNMEIDQKDYDIACSDNVVYQFDYSVPRDYIELRLDSDENINERVIVCIPEFASFIRRYTGPDAGGLYKSAIGSVLGLTFTEEHAIVPLRTTTETVFHMLTLQLQLENNIGFNLPITMLSDCLFEFNFYQPKPSEERASKYGKFDMV